MDIQAIEATFDNLRATTANDHHETEKRARELLGSRADDLQHYFEWGLDREQFEEEFRDEFGFDPEDAGKNEDHTIDPVGIARKREELPDFHDYGLCFDYVASGTFDNEKGYYRYLFSWGGPSEEVRMYDGGFMEFVFLDWGEGIGFDVSKEEPFKELWNFFEEIDSLNFEREREQYEYC